MYAGKENAFLENEMQKYPANLAAFDHLKFSI
jgi:hypothetical protein